MIVVYEVALGSGEFEVGAVLTKNGILSSSVRGKASIIVSEGVGFMSVVKKPLPMGSSKWISLEPCAPVLLLCLLIAVPCERCQDRGVQLVR